jgi:pimeloyl-ACP methyl ester carboxylesterase
VSRRPPRRHRLLKAGAAGVVAAAAVGGAVAIARRRRERPDPAEAHDFSALADLEHHEIPSHDGGVLHVVERGPRQGRPLLFVHGVTLTTDVWRYQLRDLAGEFRVLALDQRGHGRSVVGSDGYGLPLLAEDIASVVAGLDLRDAVLVGHSMGGFAVMQFCIDHPQVVRDRVSGVVLINTSPGPLVAPLGSARLGARVMPMARRAVERGVQRPLPAGSERFAQLGTRVALGRRPSPSHVRLTYSLYAATPPEVVAGSVLAFLDMDLRAALRSVRVPALVVAGTHDRLTPPRMARDIAANLPGARLEVLAGTGHMSMLERSDELNRLIAAFARGAAVPADDRAAG